MFKLVINEAGTQHESFHNTWEDARSALDEIELEAHYPFTSNIIKV